MRGFVGWSMTKGAVSPSCRRLATKVWVFLWPKGALEQALAFQAAPAQPPHLRCGARLIDEHQTLGLKPHSRLTLLLPFLARRADVRPILFAGQRRFF